MKKNTCYLCSGTVNSLFEKSGNSYVKCSSCGLIYIETSDKKSILEGYSKEKNFLPREGFSKQGYDKLIKTMNNRMDIVKYLSSSGKELLDVGCGRGDFLFVAKENNWNCRGVELSEVTGNYTREKLGVKVFDKELREIGIQESTFNVVTLWHVMEHFFDPLSELKEVYRILKKKGIVCAEVPNVDSLTFKVKGRNWKYINSEHIFYFNNKNLKKIFESAGFNVLFVTGISGMSWWGRSEKLKKILHKIATKLNTGDHLIIAAEKK